MAPDLVRVASRGGTASMARKAATKRAAPKKVMAKKEKGAELSTPLVNNPDAPEIFVDGYSGVSIRAGVIKFNFFTSRLKPDLSKGEDVLACRLAMATPTVASVHQALGRLLDDMEKDGIIRREQTKVAKKKSNG